MMRAPTRKRRGPGIVGQKNTIYRHVRRLLVSTPAVIGGVGCEDRISVTGDHLSFDGICGVHPSAEMISSWWAIQWCSALPFLYFHASVLLPCCPPVSKPHATWRPLTPVADCYSLISAVTLATLAEATQDVYYTRHRFSRRPSATSGWEGRRCGAGLPPGWGRSFAARVNQLTCRVLSEDAGGCEER